MNQSSAPMLYANSTVGSPFQGYEIYGNRIPGALPRAGIDRTFGAGMDRTFGAGMDRTFGTGMDRASGAVIGCGFRFGTELSLGIGIAYVFRPNGALHDSPGQRPGYRYPKTKKP